MEREPLRESVLKHIARQWKMPPDKADQLKDLAELLFKQGKSKAEIFQILMQGCGAPPTYASGKEGKIRGGAKRHIRQGR